MCIALASPIYYRACRTKVLYWYVENAMSRFYSIKFLPSFHNYWFNCQIEPAVGDSAIIALLLFLYPINFFYSFLFYTDTASTLSIVIVYSMVLSQSRRIDVASTVVRSECSDTEGSFLRTRACSIEQLTLLLVSVNSCTYLTLNFLSRLLFLKEIAIPPYSISQLADKKSIMNMFCWFRLQELLSWSDKQTLCGFYSSLE